MQCDMQVPANPGGLQQTPALNTLQRLVMSESAARLIIPQILRVVRQIPRVQVALLQEI